MQTKQIYFEDSEQTHCQALILSASQDENGWYVVLNQTVFYPQGGGQPSDSGFLNIQNKTIKIQKVKWVSDEIRHYTDFDCSNWVGQVGKCEIHFEKRKLHSRLHTSGHLISHIVEKSFQNWKAAKGHHFPGECYIEFTVQAEGNKELSVQLMNQEIQKVLGENSPVVSNLISLNQIQKQRPNAAFKLSGDQSVRIVQIGDFPFSPCGGTHVKNTNELNGLKVTKIKTKSNHLKINYEIS